MSNIAAVIIGRNEGERLRHCLTSVCADIPIVIYVDSGSTDGSPELAESLGATVIQLKSGPFTAAKGRHLGYEAVRAQHPDVEFVHFFDGDCRVADGWVEAAVRTLTTRPDAAVVCGFRREVNPQASIYNALCDLEWHRATGDVATCGGDALFRVSAYEAVGGYDATVPAGEEPELCQRLHDRGWKVVRIAHDMTWHDAALLRFTQWWKRQVRGGYGAMDVCVRFRLPPDASFRKQVRSARVWAMTIPAAIVFAGLSAAAVGGMAWGAAVAGLCAMVLPAQAARLALRIYRRGEASMKVAVGFGILSLVAKVGHAVGHISYVRDRRSGRHARLIEYKGPMASDGTPERHTAAEVAS